MAIKKLFDAVQDHSEFDAQTFSDIANYGAQSGFGNFIYYTDTAAFFDKNKALIIEHVKDVADELGEDYLDMVANFNCLKKFELHASDIAETIYGNDHEEEMEIKNALAWFALEEVARAVDDKIIDPDLVASE